MMYDSVQADLRAKKRSILSLAMRDAIYLDDIDRILAVRYKGVRSGWEVLEAMEAPLGLRRIEEIPVNWTDERPPGTHAYRVLFLDGVEVTMPIYDYYY